MGDGLVAVFRSSHVTGEGLVQEAHLRQLPEVLRLATTSQGGRQEQPEHGSALVGDEPVSDTMQGLDEAWVARIVAKFLSDIEDVRVHRPRGDVG